LSPEYSYEDLVGHAANWVEELFKEKSVSVAVLAGPGSSRLGVAGRVPASVVVSYKLTGLEELQEVGRAELLRFEGGEPLAGDKALTEYVGESRLTGVIVVPESTMEAVRAYSLLRERLGEDKVALVFMPGVHGKHLEGKVDNLPDEVRKTIKVDYSAVFNAFNAKPEGGGKGVSLKLLQYHGTGKWGRLRRGAEALRGLSPSSLGLVDVLRGFGERIAVSVAEALAGELYVLLGGAALASSIAALVAPEAFPTSLATTLGKKLTAGLVVQLPRELLRLGGPKKEGVRYIAELIQAAIIASEFVDDERLEGVADEVASRWGLSLRGFRNLVENLRKLATQEVATEDELKRLREEAKGDLKALEQRLRELFEQRIDQLEKGLEERLGKLEERFEELEKRVSRIEGELRQLRALAGVYQEPGDLGFDLERGTFKVENNEYRLVTSGRFVEHAGKLLEALERGELVVVTGPRGVGKSVLARYALAKLLQSGHWRVYEVETLDEESAAEVADSLARVADSSPWRLAVLYDPSAPVYYEPGYELQPPPGVGPTVWALARLHSKQRGRVPVVVVLPEDLYEQVKDVLKGAHVLRVDLRQEDFLADIIRAYSRGACGENVYESIAREIVANYKGGYTLVARSAGEWLHEAGGCDEKAVLEALKAGAGSAEAFIALFIYKAVFTGNLDLFEDMVIPFIARAKLGLMPPKWLERFPALRTSEADGSYVVYCFANPLRGLPDREKSFIREWLSQPKEDIVEGVIEGIVSGKLSGRLQGLAEKGLASREILEIVRGMEERVKEVKEALSTARFEGKCKREDPLQVLFEALASDPELRELAEKNSYHFAALVGLAHTLLPAESLLKEVGFPEGLEGWLTIGGEVPRSARMFLVEVAPAFRDAVNPCEVLKEVHSQAEKERGYRLTSLLAALGALAISEGELEGCLNEAAPATVFVFRMIPLSLVSPVLARISEALKKLVVKLMREGRWLEAVAVAYSAAGREPELASDLLRAVEQEAGGLDRLKPLTRMVYEEADHFAREARGVRLGEWARRVEAFLGKLEEDVVGLYARALLGARLAGALSMIGSAEEAREWAGEARRALEQLEQLDRRELAESLERLLKIREPFREPGEAAELELAELEFAVLNEGTLIELESDAGEALRLAERLLGVAEKLGLSRLAFSRSLRARAMLLAGRKPEEVIREIRESWELARKRDFIDLGKEAVEAITAEYVASFLLEGKPREALERYWKYGFPIRDPRFRAMLLALMLAFGAEEVGEDVEKVREEFEDYRRIVLRSVMRQLKEAPGYREMLGKLEPHLKELALEVVAAAESTATTFVEVVRLACLEGRADLAKAFAESWQREFEERDFTFAARLWRELAESLKGGCGKELREPLIRLFYLHV